MAKVQDNSHLDLLVGDSLATFSMPSIDKGMDSSPASMPMLEEIDFYVSPSVFSTSPCEYAVSSSQQKVDTENSSQPAAKRIPRDRVSSNIENVGSFSTSSELLKQSNSFSNEQKEKFKAKVKKCSQNLKLKSDFQTDLYNTTSKPSSHNQNFEKKIKTIKNEKFSEEVKSDPIFSRNSDIKSLDFEPLVLAHSSDSKTSTKIPQYCPQCKSKYSEDRALRYFHVSLEKSILLCSTENCTYPFDTHNAILNVKDENPEDLLKSEIDFDIENISINTNHFENELVQLNNLVQPFLNSLDDLKRGYEKLQSGDFSPEDYQVVEDNYECVNLMNQAIESPPEKNLNESLMMEAANALSENVDLDGLMEEDNMDIEQMLERFI